MARFNPRAPCGARLARTCPAQVFSSFQSTRPVRGATPLILTSPFSLSFQSTRPMRGATSPSSFAIARASFQSTRPMRGATYAALSCVVSMGFQSTRPMRGATSERSASNTFSLFQSTRPMRGATAEGTDGNRPRDVSIHAPHAGRDGAACQRIQDRKCFNPRAPCGARPRRWRASACGSAFQSTRPMRGAT